jgi:hypothetical protein
MRRVWIGLVASAVALSACGTERPRTQVMLIVDADSRVRAETTRVAIEIRGRAEGATAWEGDFDRTFDVAATAWPIEVAMVPAGDDASREWRATVRAQDASGGTRVEARAIGGFVAGQTLSHRVVLEGDCIAAAACGDEQTCGAGGTCVAARIDDTRLVPYVPQERSDAGVLPILDGEVRDDASQPPDAGGDGGPPCLPATTNVDMLLMVDNSASMSEEQASLADALPAFVMALSTGDVDGDGVRDVAPIDSLRIGVITTDMGTGGIMVPTCDRGTFGSAYGDDGVLITRSRGAAFGCTAVYPQVFEYARGTTNLAAFVSDVSCVAVAGTGGCGFEQPLEAVLKAIAPRTPQPWTAEGYMPIHFLGDTFGHGSDANADLFRDESILLVLLLTDEEDCSTTDPGLFDPDNSMYDAVDLNLRCHEFSEVPHPIARYVDGLRAMRRDPRQLVYAAITGIPVDATPGTTAAEHEAILDHPAMTEEVDPTMPTRLRPSCNEPGRGVAFPPRRIVSVARELAGTGAGTAVHSICQADFTPAFRQITRVVGERVEGTCD